MMGPEFVPETPAICKQTAWLIAVEYSISQECGTNHKLLL
jgi:hypothetical protein